MSQVKPIPDDYQCVNAYLIVEDAAAALEFYKKAFNATEFMRMGRPDGKVGHAEIRIGKWPVMLADEVPSMDFRGPKAFGGTPVSLHFYTEDVDALSAQAAAAGAEILRPVQDMFYGDRSATLKDPFGHVWTISTHKHDLTPEQMQAAACSEGGK